MKQQWTLRRKLYNGGMRGLVWLCAGLTCALLCLMTLIRGQKLPIFSGS